MASPQIAVAVERLEALIAAGCGLLAALEEYDAAIGARAWQAARNRLDRAAERLEAEIEQTEIA